MDTFMECDDCKSKPGSIELCAGCINNRSLISQLHWRLKRAEKALEIYMEVVPNYTIAVTKLTESRLKGN